MSNDEKSEQSSISDGASYDEVFGLDNESEGFSCSLEREMLAQSPDDNVKSYTVENVEVVDEGEDKVEEGERKSGSDGSEVEGDEESLGGPGDNRPFILPEDWAVNKFIPMMSDRVFKELCPRY